MMKTLVLIWLAIVLIGCAFVGSPGKPAPQIQDSAYEPIDRKMSAPADYGLYSYFVTKASNENARRFLNAIFTTTGSVSGARYSRENINIIIIPVNSYSKSKREMRDARQFPERTVAKVMGDLYDFGQASFLIGIVCTPERGVTVMAACGSTDRVGPFLVSSNHPITDASSVDQKMLILNLENKPPAAIEEIAAAYRRQILRKDFADRVEVDGWRLGALNVLLNAASLLPGIKKAFVGAE